jgi:hypothetical protein
MALEWATIEAAMVQKWITTEVTTETIMALEWVTTEATMEDHLEWATIEATILERATTISHTNIVTTFHMAMGTTIGQMIIRTGDMIMHCASCRIDVSMGHS